MTERQGWLDTYSSGTDLFIETASALTDEQMDRAAVGDDWSPRQIVHHMADAEMRSAVRLRQLIAEDSPTIHGYDEEEYARRLPDDRSVEVSLQAIAAARASNLDLLARCGQDVLAREGTHTESDAYSVATWLEIYSRHAHEHAQQLKTAAGS